MLLRHIAQAGCGGFAELLCIDAAALIGIGQQLHFGALLFQLHRGAGVQHVLQHPLLLFIGAGRGAGGVELGGGHVFVDVGKDARIVNLPRNQTQLFQSVGIDLAQPAGLGIGQQGFFHAQIAGGLQLLLQVVEVAFGFGVGVLCAGGTAACAARA